MRIRVGALGIIVNDDTTKQEPQNGRWALITRIKSGDYPLFADSERFSPYPLKKNQFAFVLQTSNCENVHEALKKYKDDIPTLFAEREKVL